MATNLWRITDEDFMSVETGYSGFSDAEEMTDLADSFDGYEGMDFHYNVQRVADRLFNIHQFRDVTGNLVFTLTSNADGELDGGQVMLSIPHAAFYLVESMEFKHMTDNRGAIGLEGLLAIKSSLMGSYGNLRHYADEKGML